MKLPLFIHERNRISMLALCGAIFAVGYLAPNRIHIFPLQFLPMTSLDLAVPFWEWTIYIYLSEYFLFVWAYFLFERDDSRNRFAYSFLGTTFVASLFFFLFPTQYPRADYPLSGDLTQFTTYVFHVFRVLDHPSNTLPSHHVCCCFLTAFSFLNKGESRKKFVIFFTWAFFISVSTLTTKQHYVVDVFAGFLSALGGYWLFFRTFNYVSLEEFKRKFKSSL